MSATVSASEPQSAFIVNPNATTADLVDGISELLVRSAAITATLFVDDEEHQLTTRIRNNVLWDLQGNLEAAKQLFEAYIQKAQP